MKRLSSISTAAISLALLSSVAFAGTRPRYGGTLRIESRDSVTSIDNLWVAPDSVLAQQLTRLLFDRLVDVDAAGRVRPSLAVSWQADAQQRVWEFELRPGVTLSDGSELTPQRVVAALSKVSPRWKIAVANTHSIIIETEGASADLPGLLSLPEYSIVVVEDDKTVLGSGPFRVETFQAARRIVLAANDDYWGGRPYLDRVEVAMGGSMREQLISRRLDVDDVAELSLDQARTIGYGSAGGPGGLATQRMSTSQASDLYALVFFRAGAAPPPPTAGGRNATDDARVREAIALTIDRTAISRILLQRQAEAAGSLLPQWLTGYGFLFPAQTDLERARKLRSDAIRNAVVSIPVAYDSGDNVARAIAERIVVNARELNITLQVFGEKNLTLRTAGNTGAQAVLVRLPLGSEVPSVALADLMLRAEAKDPGSVVKQSGPGAESEFASEREALQDFRVVPLVHVPQVYWLSPRVHDWATPPAGGWQLQDVWLENERPAVTPTAVMR